MTVRQRIFKWASRHSSFRTADLVPLLGLTRQTVSEHLSCLVTSGDLVKMGSTRSAIYALPDRKAKPSRTKKIHLVRKLRNLQEDVVFKELDAKAELKRSLNRNAYRILAYAFTEMLNNAIDHSRARTCEVRLELERPNVVFSVRDAGIGAFFNVMKTFHLDSEFVALEHLFKGKQSTDPSRHSGEGIFFTSRIADIFTLRSHRLEATIDNVKQDMFLKETRFLKGTEVSFSIKRHSKKKLSSVFSQFTNEDYQFERNLVRVKLSQFSGALSRSQARRLLFGLEKFKRIEFDFSGISEIGQAFADEIFRVFKAGHTDVDLTFRNANPVVAFMIGRAMATRD